MPPEITLYPLDLNSAAKHFAFSSTDLMYSLKLGSNASLNATALPAITCINGPPCMPGITAASINSDIIFVLPLFGATIPYGFSKSFPNSIIPPLGPRNVLCVLVETT